MFDRKAAENNFKRNYHINNKPIDHTLNHFLNGEFKVMLPERFEELIKMKDAGIPVRIMGDSNTSEIEYIKVSDKDGYNLIRIYEPAHNDMQIKMIIQYGDPDTYGDANIRILEYGKYGGLYFTKIRVLKDSTSTYRHDAMTISYYNSETRKYFDGLESDFSIFEQLQYVGINDDDRVHIYEIAAEDRVPRIKTIFKKYDEVIKSISDKHMTKVMNKE